jgi:hypothetical protein
MNKFFAYSLIILLTPSFSYAYIDPGTGSILLQVIIAGVVSAMFAIKLCWHRIKAGVKKLFCKCSNKTQESNGVKNFRANQNNEKSKGN